MLRLWLESEGKKKNEKLLFSDPGYRKAEDSRMAAWMESDGFFFSPQEGKSHYLIKGIYFPPHP